MIGVLLVGIAYAWAIVSRINNSVTVHVTSLIDSISTGESFLAGVPDSISVRVFLVRIIGERTVIFRVGYSVAVELGST